MKHVGLLALLLTMAAQAAGADAPPATLKPADFNYRVTLRSPASGQWPFLRFALPHLLNGKLGRPDLGDLRVFNAAGQELPYSLVRLADGQAPTSFIQSTWHPLAADATLDDMQHLLQPGGAGSSSPASAQSYLVDLSSAGRDGVYPELDEMVLTWEPAARSFTAFASVDVSNDLKTWHTRLYRSRIVQLNYRGRQIIQNRLGLNGARARYLRLKWLPETPPLQLISIGVTAWNIPARPIPYYGAWPGLVASASSPGNFVFDAGRSMGINRLDFGLLPAGTFVAATISVRDDPTQGWRQVAEGSFYRLTQDGITVENPSLQLPSTVHARYWLIHTDPESGKLPLQRYEFSLAWVPTQLVFRRWRPGPYVFAFGNPTVTDASVPLSQLLYGKERDLVTALSQVPRTEFVPENFTDQNEDPAVWSYNGPQAPDPPATPIHLTPPPGDIEPPVWLDWSTWTVWAAASLVLLSVWLLWRRRA